MKRWARWLAPAFVGAAAFRPHDRRPVRQLPSRTGRPVDRVVMFASDGMRPDLMEKLRQGRLHAHLQELDEGRRHRRERDGPGLPAQHRRRLVHDGHRHVPVRARLDEQHLLPRAATRSRTARRSRRPGVLQADTIANAAERAGKKVAQIDWVGGAAANIAGPTVDFTNFFSNRGVLVGAADPVEQAGSAFFGVTYQVGGAGRGRRLDQRARRAIRRRRRRRRPGRSRPPSRRRTRTAPTTSTSTTASSAAGAKYDHAIVEPGRQDRRRALDRPRRSATSCRSS